MSWIMVPPAQAEALFDAQSEFDVQDDLRGGYSSDLSRFDRASGQPWRDDDADDPSAFGDPIKSRLPRSAPSFGPAR